MTDHNDITDECLPPLLAEIRDLIGLPLTFAIVTRWGGVRLYVPQRMPDDHPIVEAIGREAAEKLAGTYGREFLPIPRAWRSFKAMRNRRIRAEKAGGASASQLARRYHMTERMIWIILGEQLADDRQSSLF